MIQEVTQAAGIKLYITPHVLRHSFATHMYEAGVPVEAIEAMLGHTTTDETSVYIHVPETRKRQAFKKPTSYLSIRRLPECLASIINSAPS